MFLFHCYKRTAPLGLYGFLMFLCVFGDYGVTTLNFHECLPINMGILAIIQH